MKYKLFVLSVFILCLFSRESFSYTLQKMEPSDILSSSQQHLKDNFQGLIAGSADTAGTGLDTWQVGDGGDTNKDIVAGNDDSVKPFIRYIATQDAWAMSNTAGEIIYFVLATFDTGLANKPENADAIWVERNKIVFEGSTANGSETRVTVTDPTADRTIGLGNQDIDADEQLVKAWVQFNGTNGVIADKFNTTSVTRGGQGDYVWTIDVDFANELYAVVCTSQGADGATTGRFLQIDADGGDIASGAVQLECVDVANAVQDEEINSCIAIGNR